MFETSLGITIFCRAVEAMQRTICSFRDDNEGFVGRKVEARALPLQSLVAIVSGGWRMIVEPIDY